MISFAIFVVAVAVVTALRGYVFTLLWGWFVTETFGIRQISLGEGLGLALIVSLLTQHYDSDSDPSVVVFIIAFIAPFVFLAIGWVYYTFV